MAEALRPIEPAPLGRPLRGGPATGVVIAAAVVAALYFGADILRPLALAILISFALAPLVIRLRRIGFPRIPAVLAAVVLVTLLVSALGSIVAMQMVSLAQNLPWYEYNLRTKIRNAADAMPSGGLLDKTTQAVKEIGREIDEAAKGEAPEQRTPPIAGGAEEAEPTPEPVPVVVQEQPPTPLDTLRSVLGPLIGPVGSAGLIIIFVIFMLIERSELRDRLISLVDERDLARATRAIDDAAKRVSRYLLMQLLVAIMHGVPYGIGLWLIGVPNAIVWGLLATLLRFVPYLGPLIAAVCPLVLALAVDPGWSMVLMTAALILTLELFTNNVLEPWLYGNTTGLSPVAILVAAIFWTTLWGPVGLLLSVPLTVCLVVLGRHVPQLHFLDVLLGNRPAMTLPSRFYQRLLAADVHEATELAEEFEAEHGYRPLVGEILVPALALAEGDRQRRALDLENEQRVADLVDEIGDFLVEPEDLAPATEPVVLCLGGRDRLESTAAKLLAYVLRGEGIAARPLRNVDIAGETKAAAGEPRIVFIIFLGQPRPHQARRLTRRVRGLYGNNVRIVACHTFATAGPDEETGGADLIVHDLDDAIADARHHLGLDEVEGAAETLPPAEEEGETSEPPATGIRLLPQA
jgi:predicted PurR-regulated permease PerM